MFTAVIVYFQTTGLTSLDNGCPLLQSDILRYSLNIVLLKPPEFKKCEKLRKFFNCTQLSQKSEALRRTLVVYHLRMEEKTLFLFLIGNFGAKEAVAPVDEFHQLCDSPIKIFSQTFTLLFNRNA